MQKKKAITPIAYIIIEIVTMVIIGALAIILYGYPLKMNRMAIFIFSFGSSAILLFNVLNFNNLRAFFITLILLIIIITPTVFKNPTIYSVIHHACWTIALGVIIFLMYLVFPKKQDVCRKTLIVVLWIFAFTIFFYTVFMVNGLILKFRHDKAVVDFGKIALRALKFGPVIGSGIGLGNILALSIFKK